MTLMPAPIRSRNTRLLRRLLRQDRAQARAARRLAMAMVGVLPGWRRGGWPRVI